MKEKSELKAGTILAYISLGLSIIISLIYTPFVLSKLGDSEYGLFSLGSSIIGYLGILDFGLGNAVVRYSSKYIALGNNEDEYNLYGTFFKIYMIISLVVMLAGSILFLNIDVFFKRSFTLVELKELKIIIVVIIFNLAISFPLSIFSSIIIAYEKFIVAKVLNIIKILLSPLVMVLLLCLDYKSIGMNVASTIVSISISIINIYYCFKVLKIKVSMKSYNKQLIREILGYSFFIFLNIIFDQIYWNTDQFILGAVSGTTAVAIYSIASIFTKGYMNFSTAISGVLLPSITKKVVNKCTDEELTGVFIEIGRIQLMVLGLVLSLFILIGKDFILLWAGEKYLDAYNIAFILLIPMTLPLVQNVGISIQQAKNKNAFRSVTLLVIGVMNILISIPLAKALGGKGCALGSGICYILGTGIVMNIYYHKHMNLNIIKFWKSMKKVILTILTSFIVASFIKNTINLSGVLSIAINSVILIICYVFFMFKVGFNEKEKSLVTSILRKVYKHFKFCMLGGDLDGKYSSK